MLKPVLGIATTNLGKSGEYATLLPTYQIKTLADLSEQYVEPIEDGATFADNALIKAKSLALKTQKLAIGDDSGICVLGLKGFPGIYSRRWAAPETDGKKICQLLLDKIAQSSNSNLRQAKMVTSLALYDPQTKVEKVFSGEVGGTLSFKVQHGVGFGYDFIFCPAPSQKTYSEMGMEKKNKFSSRQLVAQQVKDYLESELKNAAKN